MSLPPKPVADRDTQPFWDAVAERRLVVPRCDTCAQWIWQPRPLCPRCRSESITWVGLDGAATVASWTVLHPPVLQVWQETVPFVILLVELQGAPGVRMLGQLVDRSGTLISGPGCDEGLAFDMPLDLRFRNDGSGQILPGWSLR